MNILRETRLALRLLIKTPAFTIVALLLLAFGIGANAAIFSVIDSVFLSKFPYKDPDRLVLVWDKNPQLGPLIADRVPTAYPNFQEWERQNTVFEALAGFEDVTLNRTGTGDPERAIGARVSPNFFTVLGVSPQMGSAFDAGSQAGNSHTVVLSNAYYQSHFGNTNPLGQAVTLNGEVYTVIGVLPQKFYLPSTREGGEQRKPEMWIPYEVGSVQASPDYRRRKMQVFARLKPGVTLEQARAEMSVIASRTEQQDANLNAGFGANVFPVSVEDTGKDVRRDLLVLLGAVAFVLLIVCSNIANLMLSRMMARQKEMAIRRALGAGRLQLLSQVFVESLVLCIAGGILGLVVAYFGIQALLAMQPGDLQRPEQVHLSAGVVLFTILLSTVAAVVSALAPSTQVLRRDLNTILQQSSGGHVAGGSRRVRSVLVVCEVALALVLLTGASFMMQSFFAVLKVDPGFRPDHLLTMRLDLPASKYPTPELIGAFCRNVTERLATAPGVKSASFSDGLPMTRIRMMKFTVEDQPAPKPGSEPTADMRGITTPAYFDALGLSIVQGRNFTQDEILRRAPVILMNQSLAQRLWPNQDPIGKHIRAAATKPGSDPLSLTVIGVARDTKQVSLEEGTRPEVIRPMVDYTRLTLEVRSASDPGALTSVIRSQIWSLDRDLPLFDVRTMDEIVDSIVAERRFKSLLIALFAVAALLLAAVGLYGVLASLVAQRTPEIGIRMALGAQKSNVFHLVFAQGLKLVAAGVLIGLAGGVLLNYFLASMMFGVKITNVLPYLGVALLMFATAVCAIYVPARRAINIDPLQAIRYE